MNNPNDIIKDEQRILDEEVKNNTLSPEELKAGYLKIAEELKSLLPPTGADFSHMPKTSKILKSNPEDIVPTNEDELVRDYYLLKRLLELMKEVAMPPGQVATH